MRTSVFAVVCLFASVVSAAPRPEHITARQKQLLDELMTVIHVDQLSSQMFDVMMSQAQLGFDQKRFNRFRELAKKQIDYGALVREIYANVYLKYYTDEDLAAMIAFHKTPTGQKVLATMPKVMGEVMTAAQTSLGPKVEEIYKQIADEDKPERNTKHSMHTLARALDAWSIDYGPGYPKAIDTDDLLRQLKPYDAKLDTKDVWGHPYAYAVSADGMHYRLISAGSDGVFDPRSRNVVGGPPDKPHFTEGLEADIIMSDGEFVQLPNGWTPTSTGPRKK